MFFLVKIKIFVLIGNYFIQVYYLVNAALRNQNRAAVKPWRHYIWLLLKGLDALPHITTDIVYRGIKLPLKDLGRNYKKGAIFQTHGFTSTTNDIEVSDLIVG